VDQSKGFRVMTSKRKILVCADDLKQVLCDFLNANEHHVLEVYEQEIHDNGTPVRRTPASTKNNFRKTGSCVECQFRRVIGSEIHCSKAVYESGAWMMFMDNFTCDLFTRRDWRGNNENRRGKRG